MSKKVYTGSLYDLFDKECPYTTIILKRYKNDIQKETLDNKGIRGTYLIRLEEEINELKSFALSENEMHSVISLSKIITDNKDNYDDFHQDHKKASIISKVTSYEKKQKVDNLKISNIIIGTFSTLIFIILSMVTFTISSIGIEKINVNGCVILTLFFATLILLTLIIRNLPFNKVSKRKLENVFDFNCDITKKVLKKYEWELYTDYVKNRGFLNRTLWFIKREINYNKRNPIESGLDKEEAEALINNNTKLGDLLVDIKNI